MIQINSAKVKLILINQLMFRDININNMIIQGAQFYFIF